MSVKNHYLITGATGFVGGRFTSYLKGTGRYSQISTTGRDSERSKYLASQGFRHIKGDLRKPAFALEVTAGVDTVIHCAALSAPWGKLSDFREINVDATKNLIDACFRQNVRRLVFISTPSVYTSYKNRLNIKESDTIFTNRLNHYAATKYEAEKLVLEAGKQGLEVIALRPRAVAGRGDRVIMPRILKAHETGKLKIIGEGNNLTDITSAGNLAEAILLAAEAEEKALGQVFNITNGAPMPLRELLHYVLSELGYTLDDKRLPYTVAYGFAALSEFIARLGLTKEPALTRYGVSIMAHSTTMNIEKAKELLGYRPRQSNKETIDEFLLWWKNHQQPII